MVIENSENFSIVKKLVNHYNKHDVHGNYQAYTVAELREAAQK